jgi:hypothetical protein
MARFMPSRRGDADTETGSLFEEELPVSTPHSTHILPALKMLRILFRLSKRRKHPHVIRPKQLIHKEGSSNRSTGKRFIHIKGKR